MKRIEFLKRLFAVAFSVTFVKQAKAEPKRIVHSGFGERKYLLSATVAGQQYYDFGTVGQQLEGDEDFDRYEKPNDPEHDAQLVLEPDNPYDHRAIAVHWKNYKMGYVPRKHNKVIYNLLKDGHPLQTKLRLKRLIEYYPDCDHAPSKFEWGHEMRIRIYLILKNH